MDVLYGLHPVEELLRAGARGVERVVVARERRDRKLEALVALCREMRVPVVTDGKDGLTRMAKTDQHQGVVATVRERTFLAIEDLYPKVRGAGGEEFLLALDGVEDPHNLGALLRTADAAGVSGVVMPERRVAPISAVVAKSSAGASEHVRIARVVNVVRALEQLKGRGVWVVGLDERGTMDYTEFDFRTNCCLVLGREGAGLHELVKKTCDHLLRIPMAGRVASLNVSVAGAVVMYEAVRQRRMGAASATAGVREVAKARKGLGS